MNPLKLLYPFAIIYGVITWLRNKLFDWGIFKQIECSIPIISVGNLSMGGTGKTPHIEYFISKYKANYSIAVISRGYGRKTKGFKYVSVNDSAEQVGDEPLQIKRKFEDIMVIVGEDRVKTIQKVIHDMPQINLILLDDAFQHRYVKPLLNILLTEYQKPFWKDSVVPVGRLREYKWGWKRADVIIITKCPEPVTIEIPEAIRTKPVFYSKMVYRMPVTIYGKLSKRIILVTGIANPILLLDYLNDQGYEVAEHLNFPDHHNFSIKEINLMVSKTKSEMNLSILTTEKDWMRMQEYFAGQELNLAYIPIAVEIENEPDDWLSIRSFKI